MSNKAATVAFTAHLDKDYDRLYGTEPQASNGDVRYCDACEEQCNDQPQ